MLIQRYIVSRVHLIASIFTPSSRVLQKYCVSTLNLWHVVLDIELAQDEFHSYEANSMEVVVCRNQEIGSNVCVQITPLTVDEAIQSGDISSISIPPSQPSSPNRAGYKINKILILCQSHFFFLYRYE